jgi:GntR family transcriptional regulator of arabinose operon
MAEKYVVIANKLEIELKKMRAEGNMKLPSEQSLALQNSCSRQTVRAALDLLQKAGLIEKRTGSGSYIVEESKKNKTVFLIMEDCDRYLSPALISGLRSELASSKYVLKAFSTMGSSKEEAKVISRAISEKAAALIIEPVRDLIPNANDSLIEEAMSLHIPVIYLNSSEGPYGVVHITPDYRKAGKVLTDHLKDLGRHNIACIFCSDSSAGMDEYKGYIGAVPDFDEGRCLLIPHKEEKEIISGNDDILTSFAADVLADCDAVICQNGMICHRLVSLLDKSGRKAPDDITVACFDNGYYSSNDSILSMGYDNDFFCRKLAKTVTALAEGSTPKLLVIPVNYISTLSN